MDRTGIQAKVAYGGLKAAQYTGAPYQQFRPLGANNPIGGTALRTILAAFDPNPQFTMVSPPDWGKPTLHGLMDTTNIQIGDYLVGVENTYFVSQFYPILFPLCVVCNEVLSLYAEAESSDPANTSPEGRSDATDQVLAEGWPASMLLKTRGDNPTAKLPDDVRAAYYEVLLPIIPGVPVLRANRLRDANGNSYMIASSEQTSYGNRLLVEVAAP